MPQREAQAVLPDDWAYDPPDDAIVWQFGAYQHAFDPD